MSQEPMTRYEFCYDGLLEQDPEGTYVKFCDVSERIKELERERNEAWKLIQNESEPCKCNACTDTVPRLNNENQKLRELGERLVGFCKMATYYDSYWMRMAKEQVEEARALLKK